jgi:hypothetical protein
MTNHSPAPAAASTNPMGNTSPERPDPLARIINVNASAKLRQLNPDATRAVRDMIERKRQGGDGHARG